jgi:AcrR family transcriptional regulator
VGRPQRADALRNRDKLLAVAVAAFTDLGADVPLETIAAEAGVGVGTLYRHFPNRNALIEAAYRHEVEELCDAARELLSVQAPDEALREWMGRFVQYAATKRGMADALRSAVASDSPLFAHTRRKIIAALRLLLEAGAADGTLRSDADPEDVMRAMGAVWNVAAGPEWQDQVSRLLSLLVDGLRFGASR